MTNFNFSGAESFSNQVDESTASGDKTPIFSLIDIEFVKQAEKLPIKKDMKQLYNRFEELDVKSFIRYKSTALFVTNKTENIITAYQLINAKRYDSLPSVESHFKIISAEKVQTNWNVVKLEELPFEE